MAKYDSLRKPEKKRLIREYHATHPELSYKEVGDMFGVDAAWAWRICKEGIENGNSTTTSAPASPE